MLFFKKLKTKKVNKSKQINFLQSGVGEQNVGTVHQINRPTATTTTAKTVKLNG